MNTILLKYVVEVEKEGSISKAAENLNMNQPNLSKCIRELEESVGITIFRRTSKGVIPTQKGLEFIACAKDVLAQVAEMETLFNKNTAKKQLFDIVVPRTGYISQVYTEFLNAIQTDESLYFDYRETNSVRAIKNVARGENALGIIRYQTIFEKYFLQLMEEQEIKATPLWEFEYGVLMNKSNPHAYDDVVSIDSLNECIRITHGDLSIPSMPTSKVRQIKKISQSKKEIAIYDRASQYEILSAVKNAYMLVSHVSDDLLAHYNLVYKKCDISTNKYKDVLIYKEGYKLTELDKLFLKLLDRKISELKIKVKEQ